MVYVKPLANLKSQISNLGLASVCLYLLLLCVTTAAQTIPQESPINLNTATAAQLETLPGIGPGLANRIIEHRHKHGPFKRPQDLIIVRGFSAKRFRQIAHLLKV
jgi:competence ComEA-like helix-hairpin-helix protein